MRHAAPILQVPYPYAGHLPPPRPVEKKNREDGPVALPGERGF